MSFYRKKPVVIKAWACRSLLNAAAVNRDILPDAVKQYADDGQIFFGSDHMLINTLEGEHRADEDDMVICGVKGELYPCKPDIFEQTYEEVAPESLEAAQTSNNNESAAALDIVKKLAAWCKRHPEY